MVLQEIDNDKGRCVFKCSECNSLQFENGDYCTNCSIQVQNISGKILYVCSDKVKPNQIFYVPKHKEEIKNLLRNRYLAVYD